MPAERIKSGDIEGRAYYTIGASLQQPKKETEMRERQHKICVICGKSFPCPKSNNTTTCSPECSAKRRIEIGKQKGRKWNEASRQKLREVGRTANLEKGHIAVKLSPRSGPFETNVRAKRWTLRSPENVEYTATNLAKFVRDHPEWFPNTESARTALIATGHYKGWYVLAAEENPNRTYTE